MNKLKRSYAAKVLAFILSLLFVYAALASFSLSVFAYEENLVNVGKDSFMQKVYSYAAQQTANKAARYYEAVFRYQVYGDNSSKTDIELLSSAFSPERSNAAFEIRDDQGILQLKNYEMPDYAYSYEIPLNMYLSEWELSKYEEVPTEGSTEPPVTDAPTNVSEETTVQHVPEEGATESAETPVEADTTSVYTEEPTTAPPLSSFAGIYIDQEGYDPEDDAFIFRYVFPQGNMDGSIMEYCRNLFREEEYNYGYQREKYITYYQDEFALSDNGVVYRTETRTNLLQDFDRMETDYVVPSDEFRVDYTATVYVAKTITAKDIYYYAEKLGGFAYVSLKLAIPAGIVMLLLAALMWIFLFSAAGYKKGFSGPVCGGLHKIPFDIFSLIFIPIIIVPAALMMEFGDNGELYMFFFTLPIPVVLLLTYIESLTVRLRTHTLGKHLIISYVWKLIKKAFALLGKLFRRLSDCMNIVWKFIAYYVISSVIVLTLLILAGDEALVIIYIIFKLIQLPLLMLGVLNFDLISTATKKIAQGQTDTKITSRLLFGEFRKQAQQLNAINDGINIAVQEKTKSENMKTELITNVSHDLKTPLTSIVNYVDLLKQENIENERAREYIDVIDRQSQKLKKLTYDIVDASKAATGNIKINPEKTDFGMLLGQVTGEYADAFERSGLTVVQEFPDEPLYIMSDGRLLWRVIDNLMSNICKYSMHGTRVYITLEKQGNEAAALFRNISATELNITPEELTERFVRGDASRNTEGSGLGLSISKSLTESMGGKLDIAIDGDLFKAGIRFPLI